MLISSSFSALSMPMASLSPFDQLRVIMVSLSNHRPFVLCPLSFVPNHGEPVEP
jgi:hypothetical protein